MGRIRLLPPQVAAQIAAGEVIVRPAAVVKELVENSLDAGARTITVAIEEGGKKLIRVVDDGCGMDPEEAKLSLARHATSKLAAEGDLLAVRTLGFRGEALPSIAAVSRLELITRPAAAAGGFRLLVQAGEVLAAAPVASAPGTQVSVAELFFNTPARRKFLKSKDAEQAQIVETVRHLALGYPEVQFRLEGARTLLAAPAPVNLSDRVAALYGAELASRMLPLALGQGPFQVTGLISDPDYSLASNRFQVFLVNRRVVQDRILAAVLKEVYGGLLPRGRHPGVLIALTLPPEAVDVNVHPAKAEIRFQEPGRIFALLRSALAQTLGPLRGGSPQYRMGWAPEALTAAEPAPLPQAFPGFGPEAAPAGVPSPGEEPRPAVPLPGPAPFSGPRLTPLAGAPFRFRELAVIGQLNKTYILAQGPQGLIIIDQHAAHERLLYESLKTEASQAARQALLFPRVVEVPAGQVDWVREHLEVLTRAGLELSPFGGGSFLLTAVPAFLAEADPEALVAEAVETLSPLKGGLHPQEVAEQTRLFLACRGAIKAGQVLKGEEMENLLARLDELSTSATCPHGRPLWRLVPYHDLSQSFRRPK
jgi:DNA mismatch repair protein MutL